MLVVGDQAPYEDAAVRIISQRLVCASSLSCNGNNGSPCFSGGNQVECNSKMDPTTTSFLKACRRFSLSFPFFSLARCLLEGSV